MRVCPTRATAVWGRQALCTAPSAKPQHDAREPAARGRGGRDRRASVVPRFAGLAYDAHMRVFVLLLVLLLTHCSTSTGRCDTSGLIAYKHTASREGKREVHSEIHQSDPQSTTRRGQTSFHPTAADRARHAIGCRRDRSKIRPNNSPP